MMNTAVFDDGNFATLCWECDNESFWFNVCAKEEEKKYSQ